MPNEREKEIAKEYYECILSVKRKGLWESELGRYLADYRAELTAPAEGDVEVAEEIMKNWPTDPRRAGLYDKCVNSIAVALTAARKAERSKVPPPDEIHRDGYNLGKAEAEARVEALEAGIRKAIKDYSGAEPSWGAEEMPWGRDRSYEYYEPDEIDPIFKRLAALLAGEGKGEEERPTGIPDEIVSFFPDDSVPKEEVE